jgi:hypothetical protein
MIAANAEKLTYSRRRLRIPGYHKALKAFGARQDERKRGEVCGLEGAALKEIVIFNFREITRILNKEQRFRSGSSIDQRGADC